MKIEIVVDADIETLTEEELEVLCAVCAIHENELRRFTISAWTAKIAKEQERYAKNNGSYKVSRSSVKSRIAEEEDEDEIESMEDFLA